MKATEQYFPVVLFMMLYSLVPYLESVIEMFDSITTQTTNNAVVYSVCVVYIFYIMQFEILLRFGGDSKNSTSTSADSHSSSLLLRTRGNMVFIYNLESLVQSS